MIVEPAPAKINLALHIRRKRSDGYHDLETLFAFARDGDRVTVARNSHDAFSVTHPDSRTCERLTDRASNLVTRAADAFTQTFGIRGGHQVTLAKRLPVAAGIGGGSADAAATLRALAALHDVDPFDRRLSAIAATLGADVPACLLGRTALGTGRGDDLLPLEPLGDLPLLLVNPRVGLSTAMMFAAWDGVDHGQIRTQGAILTRARQGRNDFTTPAIAHAPIIADVLALFDGARGCTLARMSGSGATCFGIFVDTATRDAAAVKARMRRWWTLATTVA